MSSRSIKGLSNKSKKIQKATAASSPALKKEKEQNEKKYKTFGSSQKELILTDLRKGVILLRQLENVVEEELYGSNFIKLIDGIKLDAYNSLLKKILSKHVDSFESSTKVLTQWRKKIKSWIQNLGKPETRGGLVVPNEKMDIFRKKVMDILAVIPCRCFPTLQKQILEILEDFHNERQNPQNPQPFDPKTCSKHWWFNFMGKNPQIKEKWESIPLERSLNKKMRSSGQNSSQDGYETGPSTPEDHNGFLSEETETMIQEPCFNTFSSGEEFSEIASQEHVSSPMEEIKAPEMGTFSADPFQYEKPLISSLEDEEEDGVRDSFAQFFNGNDVDQYFKDFSGEESENPFYF